MGLSSWIKNISVTTDPVAAQPASTPNQPPTKRQIYQNRFNHGPNLGAMFVLEKWICDGPFGEKAKGTSELDAVKSCRKQHGEGKAKEIFEDHWRNWMKDEDWQWLREHGVTAVRAPVGYWMVNNGAFADNTPFEKYAKIYSNAWNIFKECVLTKADQYGIAVLVDLHGLPGGANEQDHSGTCLGKADLWESTKNQNQSFEVLQFLAEDIKPFDNVCGLQILNEAPFDTGPEGASKPQQEFYLKAMQKIRQVNMEIPLVISDAWDLPQWVEFVKRQESRWPVNDPQSMGVIIDTHVYKCFSDDDKNKPPEHLVNDVDNAVMDAPEVDILVGEFSCVLDGQSWDKHHNQTSREDVVRWYGQKEMAHFFYRTRAGCYFWTYKFLHGRGGEWDFREMTDKGAIPNVKVQHNRDHDFFTQEFQRRFHDKVGQHAGYWQSVDPNRDWEVWRFQEGFTQGWNDSAAFDAFDNSEIGRLAAWIKSRENQHIKERGYSDLAWTYGHGFRQAVFEFIDAKRQ
jgi:aryl-phospho-beta-D-glucosidase BglC (GH1 family)